MSDGPNKDQNEKPEQQSSFDEAANKEAREKAVQHEKEEGEVHQEGVHQRTGSKLEMMERMNLYSPDTSTAANVDSIDTSTESDEEVQSSLELLGTISISILAKMFEGGIKKESVDSLSEFKQVLSKIENESQFKLLREKISNVSEKATLKKLQEILKKPSSKIYKELDKHWNEYIGKSKKVIGDAEKGFLAEAWKKVRNNPGKAVFAVAGAFALHGLYKAFMAEEKSDSGDNKPWHKKIFNKSSGMALGLMALGAILDSDKIMDFAKEYLTGETKETVVRAAENAKQAAVDALNRDIGFDEKKNRLAALLGKDSSVLEGTNLATILSDLEIQPEKTAHTEPFKGAGGAAKLIKKWLKKKGKLNPTIEKILDKFIGEDEVPVPKPNESQKEGNEETEVIPEPEGKDAAKYMAASQALTAIYCVQSKELAQMKPEMNTAFEALMNSELKLSDVRQAYDKNKGSQKIPLSELNIDDQIDTSEAALFHTCHIITRTFEEMREISQTPPSESMTVYEFLTYLGEDPSLNVAHGMQESIAQKLKDLKITSPGELLEKVGEVFDNQTIDQLFQRNRKKFIEHLANKYKIDYPSFNEKEKKDFLFIVGSLYGGTFGMDLSPETVETIASNRSVSPKVITESKKFVEALKDEVLAENGLLSQCISRYDIKRPQNKKYDQVLKRYLKPEVLKFRDGFEMALLSDGIKFDKPTESQGIAHSKDVTMVYLVVQILKRRSHNEGFPLYVGNLIDLSTSQDIDLNININFKALAPYFQKLFPHLLDATKTWLQRQIDMFEALNDLNQDPDKIKKLSEMDAFEFTLSASKSGVRGAYQIPKELALTLYENFGDVFDEETDGGSVLKMIIAMGGTLIYSEHDGENLGLVYLGGKYYFIKPVGILTDTFRAWYQENTGTAAKTYVLGTSPFIVLGSGAAFARSFKAHGAVIEGLKAIPRGALRGLAAPVNLPVTGFRALRGAKRATTYAWNVARQNTVANLELSSSLFTRYNILAPADATAGFYSDIKAWKQKPVRQLRGLFYRDVYEKARITWGKNFLKNYNYFWDINPNFPPEQGENILRAIGYRKEIFLETDELIEKAQRMSTILEKMREVEKLDSLSEAEFWKKMDFLDEIEINTLKRKAKNMGGFKKFQRSLSKELLGTPSQQSRIARIRDAARAKLGKINFREKFDKLVKRESTKPTDTPEKKTNPDAPEKAPAKVAGETAEVIKDARKNLETVRKEIKTAESEIKALNDVRKSPQFEGWDDAMQKRLTKAREVIANGREAELKMQKSIQAFENVQEIEGKLAKAVTLAPSEVSTLNKELQSAKKLAEESLQESTELAKNMGKASKLGRVLKYGGGIAGGIGAIFSFANAGSAGYEALTTDVEGRSTVKGVEAGLWTINAAADTAAVAVLLGAEGAAATGLSAIALPLIPITYVGVNAIEAAYEETTTDYEWAQKNPYEALHHFYTTLHSISVGDIYLSAARLSVEKGLDEHKKTMHKIYRGLVATQKDPSLLNYILDVKNHPPSDAKNKEIEKRIEANYSIYHEMYFQSLNPYGIQNYQKAQQVVLDAQMFDRIMSMRDKAKEAGQAFVLGNEDSSFKLDLCDPEFDMIGGTMAPSFKKSKFLPQTIVDKYKEDLTHLMKKDEILWTNLERMDTSYLLRLCAQMQLAVSDKESSLDKETSTLMSIQFMTLKNYLEAQRGVNFEFGIRDGALFEPRMSTQEILESINELGSGDMKAYYNFEKQNYNPTPSTHALFRLAEFLGYTGEPTEIGLKGFFSEGSASFRGIYWDGENWYLQERGNEFDDNMGPDLNEAMIKNIIEGMRNNPDDILEHRNDALFLDALDYTKEVNLMAEVLEKGLAEGKQRGYKEAKDASTSTPPTQFQEKTVDYEKKEKDLESEYKEAINHVKEECNWSRLKYRIVDDNTINLSRTDSSTSVKLTRSGNEWNVGGYKGGLTLSQAIVLGNLKNKVEKIIVENDHTGGSDTPFENDGGSVDFDRNWNPNDLRILDKDKGWLGFYDEIGISVNDVVEVLNSWYKKR